MKLNTKIKAIPFVALLLCHMNSFAADAVAGKTLYLNTSPMACSVCHGTDVSKNQAKILKGANNPNLITSAINGNVGGMGVYKTTLTATQIADIAAFIANPNATATAPAISLSSTAITFASQSVGSTSAAQTITVNNTGTAGLNFTGITLAGTNALEFTKSGTCSTANPVAAGSSCTVTASFIPNTIGTKSANISLTHNATGSPNSITLSGTAAAAAAPAISLSSTAFSFASQTVGSTSTAQTLTLSNTGTANLTINSVGFTGTNASEFSQATGTTCTNGVSIAPSGNCLYKFTFNPMTSGNKTAGLSVAHNSPNSPSTATISAIATAASSPVFSMNSNGVNFGNQTINTNVTQPLIITNNGNANLNVGVISITGTNSTLFNVDNLCNNQSILPSATCTFNVGFNPTTMGAKTANLNIAHNAIGTPSVFTMAGTGVTVTPPTGAFDLNTFNFGNQTTNTNSTTKTFTLTNSGPGALMINSIGVAGSSDFVITGGTCVVNSSISSGSTCTVIAQFTPSSAGSKTGSINITSNATGSISIALNGTGVAPAAAVMTTSVNSLDFGYQATNTSSAAKTLTISNTGNANLLLLGLTIPNGFIKDTLTSTCAIDANILPSSTCNIGLIFAPTTSANFTSSLLIDSNSGSKTLSLTGTSIPNVVTTPVATLSIVNGSDFGNININTTSVAKTFTLTNTGNSNLLLSSISSTTGFAVSHNCTASLAPQASCSIQVNFTPTTTGAINGTLDIAHNSGNGSSSANLTGTGVDPNAGNGNGGVTPTPSNPNGTSNVGNTGGCSSESGNYTKNTKVDPTFFVMLLIGFVGLTRRKFK